MDTLMKWLLNVNLLETGLTVLFTAWLTTKASKDDMLKGIDVSERNKDEIIAEIRGQVQSVRGSDK